MTAKLQPTTRDLTLREGIAFGLGAVLAFGLAYTFDTLGFLVLVWLYCLLELSRARTRSQAMNIGWAIGILIYGPQLTFFIKLFGPSGAALWLVLAFWLGLFLVVLGECRRQWGARAALILSPILWLGFEYLRSECYYLRFSWLNAGYAFTPSPQLSQFAGLGVYGIGFVLMVIAAILVALPRRRTITAGIGTLAFLAAVTTWPAPKATGGNAIRSEITVAGIQFEGFTDSQALRALDDLRRRQPEAQLLVLCEYAFDGPIPEPVRAWCREHQKYLVAGGTDPVGDNYYNTAYVVDPRGEIVFQQVKTVPLPFFKDGLPARGQKLWESPWGKLGICICYDLSFVRVTDELIRQGAQALIVPTMDAADWGEAQHRLHTRVARMRAAEYEVPIFRVASSGISQLVDQSGRELATASFPGELETLAGTLQLRTPGTLTLDRLAAPWAALAAALLTVWVGFVAVREWFTAVLLKKLQPASTHENIAA
jgi:apolipoprotein N-acyltransferase